MAVKRLLTEFGMGSSLRRQDYTEAASRAVKDALWHNSINLAELYGKEKTEMIITVDVGVQNPDAIDTSTIAAIFPYGQVTVIPRKGGLDVPRTDGGKPEGFSMRAGVQHFLLAGRAARVDKPRKVEAAGASCDLWGKSTGG